MVEESGNGQSLAEDIRSGEVYGKRFCSVCSLGVVRLNSAHERLRVLERDVGIKCKVV